MEQHHDVPDVRWQTVRCSRCERAYKCTPWDDFYDPREEFGWHKGGVCYDCLLDLYRAFQARHGDRLPLRDQTETRARERMLRIQMRRERPR